MAERRDDDVPVDVEDFITLNRDAVAELRERFGLEMRVRSGRVPIARILESSADVAIPERDHEVDYDRNYDRYNREYDRYERHYDRYERHYDRYERHYDRYDREYDRYDRYDRHHDLDARGRDIIATGEGEETDRD